MLIANEKKQENIIEYLLYMYQVEDLLRAIQFDVYAIQEAVINKMTSVEDAQKDVRAWYDNLVVLMHQQDITQKGHLDFIKEIQDELIFLHNTLLGPLEDKKYQELYKNAKPFIEQLKAKGNAQMHDIEVSIVGMYGKLVLNMQNKPVTHDTEEALEYIRLILAYLAIKYKEFKSGVLKFQLN